MDGRHGDELRNSKRDQLIHDHLKSLGIFSIEDAEPEQLDEANAAADKILGEGKDD